ncbi:hypothetical protein HND25_27930 [Rhodococcus erythropolis]|uniref:hypothetical protein n=1 Tax=Rhodococcus erythropolis TaxID=1833 RepID=UPI000B171038|nr:hypothetical protein [Rhodococcus erythropolis]MBO8150149.1 hypothetical protein [Rhodococcus erythropolis]MDO1492399.1 hypothetical protein [Rhodococcus erythropolis]GCB57237.1 hypothetical protein rerp_36450 [Rhodococcus erythropolis]
MTNREGQVERIGFTGHQGLTDRTTVRVGAEINKFLSEHEKIVGFCSLAEGADQLFANALIEHGGQLVAVIPCENYESTFTDSHTLDKYRSYLSAAAKTIQLDYPEPNEDAFWGAGKKVVEQSNTIIAVWDGKNSKGLGGTGDVVKYARELGKRVNIIWPPGSERK